MKISPIQFIFQEKRTLYDASIVTEVCVTGSMRTTPSLSMRTGSRTVHSSKTSKVTCNVFIPVCDSVHREGSASGRGGGWRCRLPQVQCGTWVDTHLYTEYGQRADSTHPTGMHSCYIWHQDKNYKLNTKSSKR